jgi:hypothetical protein
MALSRDFTLKHRPQKPIALGRDRQTWSRHHVLMHDTHWSELAIGVNASNRLDRPI